MKQFLGLLALLQTLSNIPAQTPCLNLNFRDTSAPCIALYDPVCGCNGVTYDNSCIALLHNGITGFVPGACDKVTGPCMAQAAIAARFHQDAKSHACYRQLAELADSTNIPIADSLYQRALKGLVAVYLLPGNTARDQVFAYMTRFHHALWHSTVHLSVGVDTALLWGKNIRDGIFPCGEPLVDSLMMQYNLLARSNFAFQNRRWLEFQSPLPLNTVALGRAFLSASGVFAAEPGGFFGDGDRTAIQSWGDPMVIDFSYGWGDCPAGCILRHYWRFEVDDNCQANFVTSWGDPLPPLAAGEPDWVRQFEVTNALDGSGLHIQLELSAAESFAVRVWNSLGQLQQERRYRTDRLDEKMVWSKAAASGLYFVELSTGKGRITRKIVR